MSGQDLDTARRAMIVSQLRPNKVTDVAVLEAMEALPRERFVGDGHARLCYRDAIIPLAPGRGLNAPLVTARLLDRAQVQPGERVLLVGAATGYSTALLARIGAEVVALEEDATLLARLRDTLADTPKVTIAEGPLAAGWSAGAPYALILIEGGVEQIPQALCDQLAEGGRLLGGLVRNRLSQLVYGKKVGGHIGFAAFADIDTARLPGFAPEPAFTF
ncbi:protein-L-isoaspartate O-methyltransferase family protein [Sphingomonas morindae]|uniref:Protein-L-isoaspartate O-methyltransferase n=1 Tax=Sphingomonas morindae TaxID=1541170 RepID=A0ABY4X6Y6_9SPHN|nr:protein-L-isoaspartate O-methyltransferase [Sphingomonas morindae]USI72688.1 protein-L-isoaspartate O-methyltransferase [Sphingomonas morindae]